MRIPNLDYNANIEKFFKIIKNSKDFAYDVETNGLDWKRGFVCGYSVSDGIDAMYIPVRHMAGGNIEQVENFEKYLNKCFEEHPGKIIGHHIKFDMHFSQNHSVSLGNKVKDTMTRAALLDENKRSYSLGACAKEYPDIPQKLGAELHRHIAQVTGCSPNYTSMGNFYLLPGDDVLANEYAATDTLATYGVYDRQREHIYGQNLDVVEDMESELTYVLQKMERRGIGVDIHEFNLAKEKITDLHLDAYTRIPLKDSFEPVNVRSGKDLREYFEMCEIDDWPYTKPSERHPEGQPSFNKDYLETSDQGMLIVNARKYDHLISNFITPFEGHVFKDRIHTTFNQTRNEWDFGARPGRLSCTNPNLQQVPKRDEELGRIYRRIFTADPNYVFVEFDHSQAEPRLYAHYSGEDILIRGYTSDPFIDMHTIAAEMMNIPRKVAKNLNLGILYTMGATKLATKLKIPVNEAYKIISRWKSTFKNVDNFTNMAKKVAEQRGYVRTILGRRARFPDPRWAYRAANRIVQGSSADILKWKLVQLDRWIVKNNYEDVVQLILNIHDAVLLQIHNDYRHLIPQIGKMFAAVQEAPFNLRIPFHSDYHEGDNWSIASYGQAA